MKNNNYAAPEFEVVEIAVERGFEVSTVSGAFSLSGANYEEVNDIW